MVELRGYQSELLDRITERFRNGQRRVLAVAPTGSGKTVLFSNLASRVYAKGKRVTILVHRDELVHQVSAALSSFDIPHGIIAAGKTGSDAKVMIASVFTLARRLDKYCPPHLLIIDEAHHCVTNTTWGKVQHAYRHALVLGVTATPQRLSGEGLDQCFDVMELGPTVRELIDAGFLAEYRLFAPSTIDTSELHKRGGDFRRDELVAASDKPSITGDAVAHYRRVCDGQPAVAFCVSIAHAQHVAEQFRAAGYRAAAIDGGMDIDILRRAMTDFRCGALNLIASCDLISEGVDVPGMRAAILLRPTASLGLYLQQVGRVLRPQPGKTAIILDHAGNTHRHGLPDDVHAWTLAGGLGLSKSKTDDGPSVKTCQQCYACCRVHLRECPECHAPFQVKPRVVAEVDGELQEVDPTLLRRDRMREQGKAGTLDQLIALGVARGYKNPVKWASMIHAYRVQRGRYA